MTISSRLSELAWAPGATGATVWVYDLQFPESLVVSRRRYLVAGELGLITRSPPVEEDIDWLIGAVERGGFRPDAYGTWLNPATGRWETEPSWGFDSLDLAREFAILEGQAFIWDTAENKTIPVIQTTREEG